MRTIMTFLACFAFVSVSTACSRSAELCEVKCNCEGCSDREYEECLIDQDLQEDLADNYGCGDYFALAHDCTMVNNNCTSIPATSIDIFSPEAKCSDEIADWLECIDDNSSL